MAEQKERPFQFKQFDIHQDRCTMKVSTDGVLLGAWADVAGCKLALDVGTGTGLIAVMLGQRAADMEVHAVEIDPEAYEQARENMAIAPWGARLKVFLSAIQDFAKTSAEQYPLIVSNPPFFSGGTFSGNQSRNNVRHTVKLPHGDLLGAVRTLLAPDGRFCLILPYIEGLRFQELAINYHLYCTRVVEVRPRAGKPIERLLMQFERSPEPLKRASLAIQQEKEGEWTEAYRRLTGEFYLRM